MKKNILAACSLVAISGLSLAAQQPPQPQPLPQTPPTEQTPPSQPAQPAPEPTTAPAPAPSPTTPSPSPTTPSPATRASSPMSDMAKTATTVTGCLKTWDSRTMAPATGSGSGAGSAASPVAAAPSATGGSAQFVLSNIDRTGVASRTGASSFLLKTSDSSVSFSQHLNHKVEVTGTLSDSARSTATADKPSADRDATASGRVSADDMKLPVLNVTALKMVSPTCGTGSN
ncbi:MAG: hypothetical protein ABIT71_01060 [Vicinamibacteraceae bacterium]